MELSEPERIEFATDFGIGTAAAAAASESGGNQRQASVEMGHSCLFCFNPAPPPGPRARWKLEKSATDLSMVNDKPALGNRELFEYFCRKVGLERPPTTLVATRLYSCKECSEIHKALTEVYAKFKVLKTEIDGHVGKLKDKVIKAYLYERRLAAFKYPGVGGRKSLQFRHKGGIDPKKCGAVVEDSKQKDEGEPEVGAKRLRIDEQIVNPSETLLLPSTAAEACDDTRVHFSVANIFDDFDFDSHPDDWDGGDVTESGNTNETYASEVIPVVKNAACSLKKIVKRKRKRKAVNWTHKSKGVKKQTALKSAFTLDRFCTVNLVRCDLDHLDAIKIERIETADIKIENEVILGEESYYDLPDVFISNLTSSRVQPESKKVLPHSQGEFIVKKVTKLEESSAEESSLKTNTRERRACASLTALKLAELAKDRSEDDSDEDFIGKKKSSVKIRRSNRSQKLQPQGKNLDSAQDWTAADEDTAISNEDGPGTDESEGEDLMEELIYKLDRNENKKRKMKKPPKATALTNVECDICGLVFNTNDDLRKHCDSDHPGAVTEKCPICEKVVWNGYLLKHVRQVHEWKEPNKPLSCSTCKKKFAVDFLLQRHELRFHVPRNKKANRPKSKGVFLLSRKGKKYSSFSNKSERSPHVIVKCMNIFRYGCEFCKDRYFKSKQQLTCHITKKHSEKCTHTCSVCTTKYPTEEVLRCHEIIHQPEGPYKCPICKTTIASSELFAVHFKIHYSVIRCEICDKMTSDKQAYLRHLAKKHGGERQFACDQCEKSYAVQKDLVTHKKDNHPPGLELFKCEEPDCNKSYDQRFKLIRHRRMDHFQGERYICPLCSRELSGAKSLEDHMHRHNGTVPRPWVCEGYEGCSLTFCGKAKLDRHVHCVHLGKRDFICDKCGKGFGAKSNLIIHTTYWCKAQPTDPDKKTYRQAKGKILTKKLKEQYLAKPANSVTEAEPQQVDVPTTTASNTHSSNSSHIQDSSIPPGPEPSCDLSELIGFTP